MDLISQFLKSSSAQNKILTPEEESLLTQKFYSSRDLAVRNEIVLHNLKLVYMVANRFPKVHPDIPSEGFIGLIKGVDHFDPNKGYKISTYCSWWIRAQISTFLLNNFSLIRIGKNAKQKAFFYQLQKEAGKLKAKGIEPTTEELAKVFGASDQDIRDYELASKVYDLNFSADSNHTRDKSKIDPLLVDADALSAEQALSEVEKEEAVKKHFKMFRNSLQEKEKIVYDRRMIGEETLDAIGRSMSPPVTRESVRQIEERLKSKLLRLSLPVKQLLT